MLRLSFHGLDVVALSHYSIPAAHLPQLEGESFLDRPESVERVKQLGLAFSGSDGLEQVVSEQEVLRSLKEAALLDLPLVLLV